MIPARQKLFFQENNFNNPPVRRTAIAMKTNSAFTGSHTGKRFSYQQFDLRQFRILRGCQPIVDFDDADNCRLYGTKLKAIIFQDDIPSIPNVNFEDHCVLVFNLTSMQDATELFSYPELVGQPLKPELFFTFPLEQVTEIILLGELKSFVAVDKVCVNGKSIKKYYWISPANIELYPAKPLSVPWFIFFRLCSSSSLRLSSNSLRLLVL